MNGENQNEEDANLEREVRAECQRIGVTDEWEIQEYLLDFRCLSDPHSEWTGRNDNRYSR